MRMHAVKQLLIAIVSLRLVCQNLYHFAGKKCDGIRRW